jgi:hypothetical protein
MSEEAVFLTNPALAKIALHSHARCGHSPIPGYHDIRSGFRRHPLQRDWGYDGLAVPYAATSVEEKYPLQSNSDQDEP